jgi:predicted amidohydrolase YtcJ
MLRLLLALLTLSVAPTAAAAQPADLVLWGGPIHTADDARPMAESVAVRDGRIIHVGERGSAQALVGPATTVVDLRGAALFPGFTDAHAHLRGIGERELTLNLEGTPSVAALVERVRAEVARARPGEVIVGRGWIETGWPEGRFPSAADLDAVSPDNPVLLERADGHALVANSAALRRAGVDAKTAAPSGGEILKDAAGRPTGMLIDNAMRLVERLPAQPGAEQIARAYETGGQVYARYGWTGLHNMSVPYADVPVMERLAGEGRLPLRVYNAVNPEDLAALIADGARRAAGDGRIVTRAVKLYVDGALGSRGAALLEPYADMPSSRGLLLMNREQALAAYNRALDGGVQVTTHAIGDRGNRLVLDWYAEAFAGRPGDEDRRWRIEHAQVLDDADIPRFAALKVIASMQPSHAIGDLHFAPARLGLERLEGAYAWRSLRQAGAEVVGGSDAPVERGDPLIEFYAAVARRDLKGFSGPGWHPEQALDRREALKLFTAWPARASFQEAELGTLAVGKRADLTVFSVDLMTAPADAIPKGRALLTVVDGEIAHRAEGW